MRFTTSKIEGNNGRSDEEQLAFAVSHDMVLVSYNRKDFFRIHTAMLQEGRSHSGILLLFQNRFGLGEEMRRIERFVQGRSAERMQSMLEYITAPEFAP